MTPLDYLVLVGTILGIAAYGVWRTRGRQSLDGYLKGAGDVSWPVIGLSVMATQASAITFLSTPGQGYEDGLGFVQNYFGAPFALVLISVFFLPIYRRLKVYTAYEYLGQRFDQKTRLLGAGLFLLQRGLGAGLTIYAPAIVLSTVFGWNLNATIVCSSLVVIGYTVAGGSDAVTHTQKVQMAVIFAGMAAAMDVLLHKLTATHSVAEVLAIAGHRGRLQAVDFSLAPRKRYTFWSGLLGGLFLALSYFGTDQSQVQRYLSGSSLRQSRLGLMFNAVCKIPMQFLILMLGVLLFVFYQLQPAPVLFNRSAWDAAVRRDPSLVATERSYVAAQEQRWGDLQAWTLARRSGDAAATARATAALDADDRAATAIQRDAWARLAAAGTKASDADYVFIRFILDHLPHGLIGLLVTAFFAATLASKAGELNALASTTTIDVYRHVVRRSADDAHLLRASRALTVLWGLIAMAFALFARLTENLVQAVNIIGSIFYGVVLGLFLVAFFLRRVGGTAVFWAAVVAQAAVVVMYLTLSISYLWYNLIGCALCVLLSLLLQAVFGSGPNPRGIEVLVQP